VRRGQLQQMHYRATTHRVDNKRTWSRAAGIAPLKGLRMNKGSRHMQRVFQAVPWLLAFAIVVLSLGPPSVRPSTGAPHDLEHLLMFLATGVAFGFRYPYRLWFLAIAQVTFVGAIEVAQNWVPGRHARMSDFLVDTAASCLGVGLSYLLSKFGPGLFRR
jgi:VanZ family protein